MISHIKNSTKFFAVAPLLLLIIGKASLVLGNSVGQPFVWGAYIANVVFIFHLIVENKKSDWLSSIVLMLIILGSIGDLFRIMHWPFGPVMILLGLLGTMIMTGLFLYHSIKTTSKEVLYEQLILSLFLFAQFVLAISVIALHGLWSTYIKFLYYPIAALCGTIILKNKYENLGERNLILYLLVHSLFVIIKQTFQLLT